MVVITSAALQRLPTRMASRARLPVGPRNPANVYHTYCEKGAFQAVVHKARSDLRQFRYEPRYLKDRSIGCAVRPECPAVTHAAAPLEQRRLSVLERGRHHAKIKAGPERTEQYCEHSQPHILRDRSACLSVLDALRTIQSMPLHCAALHCAALRCAALRYAALCCAALHCTPAALGSARCELEHLEQRRRDHWQQHQQHRCRRQEEGIQEDAMRIAVIRDAADS